MPPVKQWEQRAALRTAGRSADGPGRDIARDIIRAGWTLVDEEGAFDFTVKQVIERASVALQTFYRYFGNKDELLLAMLEESMSDAPARVMQGVPAEDPVECLRVLVTDPIVREYDQAAERSLRWRGRERQRLMEHYPEEVEAVYEPYTAAIAEAIGAVCRSGRGRSDSPELDARIILHLVQAMAHDVHGGGMVDPPPDVAERVWRMVAAGLGIEAGPARGPKRRPARPSGQIRATKITRR